KVVWATGPGGERIFWAWYDTKLNLECSFDLASDGKQRCLPRTALWPGGAFADSQCTVPAIETSRSVTPPYYKIRDPSTCPPRVAVGRLGVKLPAESRFGRASIRRIAKSGAFSFQRL